MLHTQDLEFKRFLKSLLFVAIGIIAFDFAIGNCLKYLYHEQKSGLLYRTTYAIDSTTADYIVLGSSRANHNYDPKAFETVLKSSFYNCGRDKQGLLYSCAVLSAILDRYHPKCIIIDIRPDEFTQSDEGTLATLLPYYNNKAIKPYLDYNSHFENIKLLSHIYPYNSLLTNLIVGLKRNWSDDYKGYRKLTNINSDNKLDTLMEKASLEVNKLKAFNNIIDRLNALHIKTFLVISPIFYRYINSTTTGKCTSIVKTSSNLKFLNFTNQPSYQNNQLFSDNNHLNNIGAAKFSTELATEILRSY